MPHQHAPPSLPLNFAYIAFAAKIPAKFFLYREKRKIQRIAVTTPGCNGPFMNCKNAFDPKTTNTSPTSTCAIIVAIFISPPANSQAWSTPKLSQRRPSKLIQLTDKVTQSSYRVVGQFESLDRDTT